MVVADENVVASQDFEMVATLVVQVDVRRDDGEQRHLVEQCRQNGFLAKL